MDYLQTRSARLSFATFLICGLCACGTTIDFPRSNVVPAAEIEVKADTDRYDNNVFTFQVEHLADPARLSPPGEVYVVWAKTHDLGIVNLGQLKVEAGDKAKLRTSTPFPVEQLFITAEDRPLVREPAGIEIGRVAVK